MLKSLCPGWWGGGQECVYVNHLPRRWGHGLLHTTILKLKACHVPTVILLVNDDGSPGASVLPARQHDAETRTPMDAFCEGPTETPEWVCYLQTVLVRVSCEAGLYPRGYTSQHARDGNTCKLTLFRPGSCSCVRCEEERAE